MPGDELRAEVRRWADEMLTLSPTALRFRKQSFNADSEHRRCANIHRWRPRSQLRGAAGSTLTSNSLAGRSALPRAAWGSVWVTTIKGFAMRAKGITATAVLGLAAAGATGIVVPGSTGASRVDATAAQDRAALAIVQAKAFTRSVRLRRRAPLAGWGVRNTSQVDATGVETCVEFPSGFEIRYKPADRPPGVKITNGKRKACIPIQGGTIYVDSSSGFLVEGFAPRRVGTYKVRLTATASNAATARRTVNLRILRRCTRQRCPGFPGS